LDQLVFQDEQVGKFFSRHFISLTIDGAQGDGKKLRTELNVRGFPTVLFMNSEGQELNRIVGFDGSKEGYLYFLDLMASGTWKGDGYDKKKLFRSTEVLSHSLEYDLQRWRTDSTNAELNFIIAMKYAKQLNIEQAFPYFNKALKLDPNDRLNFKNEALYFNALYSARFEKNLEPLHSFLKHTPIQRYIKTGYPGLIYFYNQSENMQLDVLMTLYEEALAKMPNNADMMNSYAWSIFQHKVKDKYTKGIDLAKKAVEISPAKANIWDTLGWLYYETGDKENAIYALKKAVELSPDSDGYKKNLEKMEKDLS